MSTPKTALEKQTEKKRGPVRCLVIQLARLGDTLQSLMALKAAKQLYPELEIHFVARERFSEAAKRVPWIENVITLPTDTLLGPLLKGEVQEVDALEGLSDWLGPIADESWDFILNWSYSEASSFLTAIIPATVKLGYTRDKNAGFVSADGWSHYMQAVVQGKVDQNIHLTDIFTTQLLTALQIHVGDPVDAGDATVNSKGFFSVKPNSHPFLSQWRESTRKWIAFQLGAAQDSKTWDPERWGKLAELILTRHPDWSIILLGGSEDEARLESFYKNCGELGRDPGRVVSLVGQTGFDLWASVVSKVHWVVAGDTAVIHLASVLGTRVLNLSIGPVRWSETGPYGNGHYVIAPETKTELSPESVYGVWSFGMNDKVLAHSKDLLSHMQALDLGIETESCRMMRSRIRPTADGGGVVYEPLIRHSLSLKDWTSTVMGQIARAWFCGWVAPLGHEIPRESISPELLQQLRQLEDASSVLYRICDQAVKSSQELADKSAKLRSDRLMRLEDRQKLEVIGRKVLELDELIERMGRTQDVLRAFSQMSKVMMHNLSGSSLIEIGKESAVCYSNLRDGVKIFKDWVEHTIKMARPVSLKQQTGPSIVPFS